MLASGAASIDEGDMSRTHITLRLCLGLAAVALASDGAPARASTDLRIICRECTDASQCGDHTDYCMNYYDEDGNFLRSACGMNCGSDEDCAGLICRPVPAVGLSQCYDQINLCARYPVFRCSRDGHCDPGQECVEGHCVDHVAALGEDCAVDDDCETGLCLNTYVGDVCTQDCDWLQPLESCPDGFFCTERERCGQGICVPGEPGTGATGDACVADTDCASAFCSLIPSLDRAICTTPCDTIASTCPAGTHCERRGAGCGSCVTDCASRADCPGGMGCVGGRCQNLQDDGTDCAVDEQCRSGRCEGGLCGGPGSDDAGPDPDPYTGDTFATDCQCTAAGRSPEPLTPSLVLLLLPAVTILRRYALRRTRL